MVGGRGMQCDAPGCREAFTEPPLSGWGRPSRLGSTRLHGAASRAGWDWFTGMLERTYHFCPNHVGKTEHARMLRLCSESMKEISE